MLVFSLSLRLKASRAMFIAVVPAGRSGVECDTRPQPHSHPHPHALTHTLIPTLALISNLSLALSPSLFTVFGDTEAC